MPKFRKEIFSFCVDFIAYHNNQINWGDETFISTSADSNGWQKKYSNWITEVEIKFLDTYGKENFKDLRKNEYRS